MEWQILYGLQKIHHPFLDGLMVFITRLGNKGIIWIALAVVLLLIPKTRKWGIAVSIALAVSWICGNLILKPLIARDRPCWLDPGVNTLIAVPRDYSFPSGHTLSSFSAAFALFFSNGKIGVWALIFAGLIAFSRLYLFVHWPTDVLAGILLGMGTGYFGFLCSQKMKRAQK